MIQAIFMMGGLGVVVGIGLAVASKIFYVYVDPKVLAVDDVLPGANCGGCGYPGCGSNAEAIVAGKSSPNSCVAAGAEVAEAIAAILGVSVEAKEPDIAKPGCYFGPDDADLKYIYDGLSDCKAAALLGGGMKVCDIGCLGLGSCAAACPFGAIVMGPDRLPVVDPEKCTGCGACERVCPKHIIKLSSVTRRILREYTLEDCVTPCQQACPAGIDIREYIRQILLGDYHRSVQVIKERNPFPTVIGRICPRPCELNCRRNLSDEPVAINFLKRFAADYELKSGNRILPYQAPETGRRIAVVGGGVEGLSTAYFSARLGHDPTVFEATNQAGGILRKAISQYRLPPEILDWDIQGVMEMGVSIVTNMAIGKDMTINTLLAQGYDAVFPATGGWDSRLSRKADIEELIPGIYLVVDLIMADTGRSNKIPCGSDVVITGGGPAVLDAARICHDLGSDNITLLFTEPEERLNLDSEALSEAENDGMKIFYECGITKVYGEENRLKSIDYIDKRTREIHSVTAQNIFIASGRFPEMIFTSKPSEHADDTQETEDKGGLPEDTTAEALEAVQEPVEWIGIMPYKNPRRHEEIGVAAEGDPLTDYSAAIEAIAAGRRSAASIHQILYGLEPELPEKVIHPNAPVQDVDHLENVAPAPRNIMPLCSPEELDECGEIEKGFSEEAALAESKRCLQCGLICYEKQPAQMISGGGTAA